MLKYFRTYHSSLTVIPLILGIFISFYLDIGLRYLTDLFVIPVIIISICSLIFTYYLFIKNIKWVYIYTASVFIFGFLILQVSYDNYNDESIYLYSKKINKIDNTLLYSKIIEEPEIKDNRIKLVVSADSINFKSRTYTSEGNVIVNIYRDYNNDIINSKLEPGTRLRLTGKLVPLPIRRNPEDFDYGKYLKLHGIEGVFNVRSFGNVSITGETGNNFSTIFIYPVRKYISKSVDKFIGGAEGEFLKGLLIGERSGFAKEMKEDFINAGVAHIIAVSGLNVVYILIILTLLLSLIPVKHEYKLIIMILFLFYYMLLTGSTPSIVRAVIMASIFLISQLLQRKPDIYNIISFSIIVILLIDPLQLFDAGFILSYTAVLSLVLLYNSARKYYQKLKFYDWLNEKKLFNRSVNVILMLFLSTFIAQIGLLPITAIMFDKVSVVSLAVNIFAIPFSNLALAAGFFIVFLSLISSSLAALVSVSIKLLLYLILSAINFFSDLSFAYIETYNAGLAFLVIYYLFFFIIFYVKKINLITRIVVVISGVSIYIILGSVLSHRTELEVTYFNSGRNNNTALFTTPHGHNILINCGSSGADYSFSSGTIIPHLKANSLDKIDILLITSLNYDELVSMIHLVSNFPVKNVYYPSYYKNIFADENIHKFLNSNSLIAFDSDFTINELSELLIQIEYNKQKSSAAHVTYGTITFSVIDFTKDNSNYISETSGIQPDVISVADVIRSGDDKFNIAVKYLPEFIIMNGNYSKTGEITEKTLNLNGIDVHDVSKKGAAIIRSDGAQWYYLKK